MLEAENRNEDTSSWTSKKKWSEFVVKGVQMTEIQHMETGNDASIL